MHDHESPPNSLPEPESDPDPDACVRSTPPTPAPAAELLVQVYDELRRLAQAKINNEPAGLTLQPTALVHEAYLRLAKEHGAGWRDRNHFFSAAALAMRRILIERARRKAAQVRRDAVLREIHEDANPEDIDLPALDDALEKLGAMVDPRLVEVVQLRFFAGLSVEDAASVMGVSERTIKRDWNFARAWLAREMRSEGL